MYWLPFMSTDRHGRYEIIMNMSSFIILYGVSVNDVSRLEKTEYSEAVKTKPRKTPRRSPPFLGRTHTSQPI